MKITITILCLISAGCFVHAFDLVNAKHVVPLVVAPGEPEYLHMAVEDLACDIERITGKRPQMITDGAVPDDGAVVIGTVCNPEAMKIFHQLNHEKLIGLEGKWEAYRVISHAGDKNMYIAGSDARGTMFGIYDFCENGLGVDPLYAWSGIEPEQREMLSWDSLLIKQDEPSFKFRGWFINDEDLLTHWMESGGDRHIDYKYYRQVVNVKAMEMVAEALVRSRFNLIIPASFIDIMNPPEKALLDACARRGVFLSQHHIEPVGVSAYTFFNYWKARGKDYRFSYFSHTEELKEVWTAYAEKWAEYPNVIWQIGLRGIADRPMWMADPDTPQSDADRGRLISEAMAVQRRIIDEVTEGKAEYVSTTLWAEGSVFNQKGLLQIPEKTMVIFADNSPGWRWQKDFYETERKKDVKYGVYYHHQLIGSGPHLAHAVPPHKTYAMMKEAVDYDASEYAIFNLSNIREFVLGIAATSRMTWEMDGYNPDRWLDEWVIERFSSQQQKIVNAYRIYYSSYQIHDTQGVPFLLDGQTLSKIRSMIKKLTSKMSKRDFGKGSYSEKLDFSVKRADYASTDRDAFHAGTGDMHPPSLGLRHTLKACASQRQGFELALKHARSIKESLPPAEARFLEDNLIYPSHFMMQETSCLQNLMIASEMFDIGRVKEGVEYIGLASENMRNIVSAVPDYCYGKWKNWYRGCRKLNISAAYDSLQKLKTRAKKLNVD
ncbi:MAG: glycosyl hydrolase 115 family protein [Kiritimatiellia bacterium]